MITEVVAALIWDGGRFLICKRPPDKARGLLYEFVGGKVEPGETKEEDLPTADPQPTFVLPDVTALLNILES